MTARTPTPVDIMARAIQDTRIRAGSADELARAALAALEGAGFVVVPREPSEAMLAGACHHHKPGQPMTKGGSQECPHIEGRRIIWARMIAAAEEKAK